MRFMHFNIKSAAFVHMNNTAHIAYWKQIALLQAILQSKLESCLMFQFYQLFRLDEASFIATFLAQFI